MKHPDSVIIAARMLDCDPGTFLTIYPALARELMETDMLCLRAGGRLKSRQVVAAMIARAKVREELR